MTDLTPSGLTEIAFQIGQVGLRLAEIGAAEGAAGNMSVCLRHPLDVGVFLPKMKVIDLPFPVPELAGMIRWWSPVPGGVCVMWRRLLLPIWRVWWLSQAAGPGSVAEEADVWRSNLALVETSGNAVTLTIERLVPNGNEAGTITGYQLGARTPVQLNSVLTQLGVTTASNQRLRLRPTAGNGRVLAGVYRIDSRTGDPFSIEFSTAAAASAHTTGRFEGVVRTADGTFVDGGIEVDIATAGLSSFDGLAGLPCGADSFTVDFSATVNPPAAIAGDGTFSVSTSPINYSDGTSTIFTITWTLTGVLDTQGVLSGTLRSATTGGAGSWASCNGTIDRTWRAGWTGTN